MSNQENVAERWTVIVTVDADAETMPALAAHARAGLERFRGFDGFLGGVLRVSLDRTRLVQHVEWTDEAAYLACRDDPAWDDEPTTAAFFEAVEDGRATIHEHSYETVAEVRGGTSAGE